MISYVIVAWSIIMIILMVKKYSLIPKYKRRAYKILFGLYIFSALCGAFAIFNTPFLLPLEIIYVGIFILLLCLFIYEWRKWK